MTAAPEPRPAVVGVSEAEWQAVTRAVWKENGIIIRPTTAIAALIAAAQVRQAERDVEVEPRSGRMAWHLKQAEARAEAAEARASKAVERVKVLEEALTWIRDQEPATQEMTLAHALTQHAGDVLAALLSTTPDLGGEANDTTRGGGDG